MLLFGLHVMLNELKGGYNKKITRRQFVKKMSKECSHLDKHFIRRSYDLFKGGII